MSRYISFLLSVSFVLFIGSLPFFVPVANATTWQEAWNECEAYTPSFQGVTNYACHTVDRSSQGYTSYVGNTFDFANGSWSAPNYYTIWSYTGPSPQVCTPGQVEPVTNADSKTGISCNNECELSLHMLTTFGPGVPSGGSLSWNYVETGNKCPGVAGGTGDIPAASSSSPVISESSNPDGSHTYCDQISKKCVTTPPNITPPASSSSSPNDTTTTTSSSPASSSSSTSTSTSTAVSSASSTGGTGGTSGGTGDYTTTTTTTTQTHTQKPASASSSSCTGGACDVGQADGDVGGLYSSNGDSPSAEFAQFKASVLSSPLIQSASGFFSFNSSTACPSWHIPGNKYWGEAGFDFSFFCTSDMLQILQFAGYIVLAMAAFAAFRIALY